MKTIALWVTMFFAVVLTGCATPKVASDVTAFHEWPSDAQARSFRLVRQPQQANSLEHATYEAALRAELIAAGFTEQASARFLIGFDYSIGSQVSRIVDPWANTSVHIGGVWGSRGWGGTGIGVGFPLGWPAYGGVREVVVYERRLRVLIDDAAQGSKRVYEANITSLGSNRNLAEVLPLMLRGALAQFPGASGITRRTEVDIPPKPRS
jgi:Domain of unknown function (DUF4136)